jgi:anti-sigma B factor antagonist
MTIKIEKNADELILKIEGRLDATTAPTLDRTVNENLAEIKSLIFDFANLEYISSAGLRILLSSQKKMQQVGSMKIKSVREEVMDVLDMTGFADILTIE